MLSPADQPHLHGPVTRTSTTFAAKTPSRLWRAPKFNPPGLAGGGARQLPPLSPILGERTGGRVGRSWNGWWQGQVRAPRRRATAS
jgi:hypothetical protein